MEFLEQIQKDRKIAQDLVNNKIAADIGEAFKMIQEKRHMQVKIHSAAEQNIDGSLKHNPQIQQQVEQLHQQAQQTAGNPQTQIISSTQSSQAQEQTTQIVSDAAERLVKIEEFLQKFDKFFAKFYEDTNAKLNDFSKSINAVNFQMEELKNRKVETIAVKNPASSSSRSSADDIIAKRQMLGLQESEIDLEIPDAKQQQAPAQPKQSSTFRQKDGNYKPEDVSVEMIFNNSHNRLTKR
ncbi:TPA: hypothetical protein HA246_02415 [Candidatus Woesearchaeota archaeon]|nr:hypothetical protein [Candidatus Woesearchaeota archaeon]